MKTQKYSPNIEPRRIQFTYLQTPAQQWLNRADIHTYHFNAVALFLPLLEKMLVMSLKKSIQAIKDPQLKQEVASLIAQESFHGSAFHQYVCDVIHQNHSLKQHPHSMKIFRFLGGVAHKISPTFHLALSAAGEHYTAITGELFLKDPKWFAPVPSEYTALWRWHCIEEIEHKCVAYDVYQTLNGRYTPRIIAMLMMSLAFMFLYTQSIWKMMRQDKKCTHLSFYQQAFAFYWGKGGLFRSLLKPYFDFFKPSFHPSQHQSEPLITAWKQYFKSAPKNEFASALQKISPPTEEPNVP